MSTYMGRTLSEQVAWMENFLEVANLDPEAAGLTQAQLDEFAVLNTALQAAWATVNNEATRTKVTLANFHDALKAARKKAYELVAYVQASPVVTDGTKIALKVTVRDKTRTIKPRPDVAPGIYVRSIAGRTVALELQHDGKRGWAPYATGATVFAHIGAQPPSNVDGWKFASATSRSRLSIPFPPSETTDTVWFCAQWRNAKDESGPASDPISVVLAPGLPLPGEMEEAA